MTTTPLGLGLDSGGTKTRWALSQADGTLVAEGYVAGLTALQLVTTDGRAHIQATMLDLASQVLPIGRPQRVCAGVTGLDSRDEKLCTHVVGRARLGRITIANSDAGAGATFDTALDQAQRAIEELRGV